MMLKRKRFKKVDQKYHESFEMQCWRRIQMSWTYCVKNEYTKSQAGKEHPA
jgi:hypothetical protein